MKNKEVLIVGGTGFLGSNLANYLIKKKYKISIIHSKKIKNKDKIKQINYFQIDISNKKSLNKIHKLNFDYVVNFAGYINHSDKNKVYKSHFSGCKNLVDIFKDKNIRIFIQIGSSTEYGHLKSPQSEKIVTNINKLKSFYSKAKFLASNYILRNKHLPFVILRLYLVYGPGQKFNRLIPITFKNALKNKKFDCSDGSQIRNFMYVDDLNKAIEKCMKYEPKNKIINLGSRKSYKVKYVINKIVKICKGGHPIYGKIKLRKDEPYKLFPSLTNAKKYLKWSASTNLDTGLKKTQKFYKNYVK